MIGDGEAETGPLATRWHSNKFVNPAQDGVVLPILHLNGYKIANPTVLARIPEDELLDPHARVRAHARTSSPAASTTRTPPTFHRRFAELLDTVLDEIAEIKARAADGRHRATRAGR